MIRLIKPAAAAVGVAAAVLVAGAGAATFTLNVAKNAKVTNQQMVTTHEAIAVGLRKRAVYTLSGDSKKHPKCTAKNHCFTTWPPVTVAPGKRATKAPGITGKLSLWHRNGFFQVLLNGHPLYFYALDTMAADATGEGIVTFGGTWHVVKADAGGAAPGGMVSTMGTTNTNTVPCIPAPYYPCP
jgi:predicted lipoprotein with Yx(FWY)xxD motif